MAKYHRNNVEEEVTAPPNYMYECQYAHPAMSEPRKKGEDFITGLPKQVEINGEEVAILVFVLLLWAGAISLFYHQWGKIRGFDDYQPDYVHANMTIQHNPLPDDVSEPPVNSAKMTPQVESPQQATFSTLGFLGQHGRPVRRASRSYADLYALASQRPGQQVQSKKKNSMRKTSNSMDDHYKLPLYNIQISCDENDLGKAKVGLDHHPKAIVASSECRPSQSFDRDMSRLDKGCASGLMRKQGQSTLALHKIAASPRPFSPNHEWHNVPLTKGYLNAANRHLAASTLRLWQGSSCSGSSTLLGELNKAKRKTKSVYNLKDCIV